MGFTTPHPDKLVSLMYHRVGTASGEWERRFCVAPERFAAQMRLLRREGYRACDIDSFVAWLRGDASLPPGSFLLTFDDGYLGVHEHARPVLAELGWPATVFLVSQRLGARDVWTKSESPSSRTHPLLDRHHISELAGEGFSFQSHSRHHVDLVGLPDAELHKELRGAREDLEQLLGHAVPYLAYPYGRFDDRVRAAAIDAGYQAAFSAKPGFSRRGADPYRILRLEVFGTDSPMALARKMMLGTNDGSIGYSVRYALSRAATKLGLRR